MIKIARNKGGHGFSVNSAVKIQLVLAGILNYIDLYSGILVGSVNPTQTCFL